MIKTILTLLLIISGLSLHASLPPAKLPLGCLQRSEVCSSTSLVKRLGVDVLRLESVGVLFDYDSAPEIATAYLQFEDWKELTKNKISVSFQHSYREGELPVEEETLFGNLEIKQWADYSILGPLRIRVHVRELVVYSIEKWSDDEVQIQFKVELPAEFRLPSGEISQSKGVIQKKGSILIQKSESDGYYFRLAIEAIPDLPAYQTTGKYILRAIEDIYSSIYL